MATATARPNEDVSGAIDGETYLSRNRWGELSELASGDADIAHAAIQDIERWIADHVDRNDAAWEAYSACERVANSLVFFSSLPRNSSPCPITAAYVAFLRESLEWIYCHIEYYGIRRTNNHILNNARALVMGGAMLSDSAVLAAGVKLFRAFLPHLVTDSGFLRERSSHYQLVVMNWLLDARAFLRASGSTNVEDESFIETYVARMSEATAMLLNQNNQLGGLIGDVSPDATPQQSVTRLARLYPEVWPPRRRNVQACTISDGWFRLSAANGFVLGNFLEGCFPPSFPTHGHNDLTGFVWSHEGTTVLTDPGRFRYTPDQCSLLQKSASAHNVPLVDGFPAFSESFLDSGQLWPRPYAVAEATMKKYGNGIELAHDGYARSTSVKRHTRKITLVGNGLEVVDTFYGDGAVEINFFWHFGGEYASFDKAKMIAQSPTSSVLVQLLDPETHRSSEYQMCETVAIPESHSYGECRPTIGLRVQTTVSLPASILTCFTVEPCAA
jgi:hypothetical protein